MHKNGIFNPQFANIDTLSLQERKKKQKLTGFQILRFKLNWNILTFVKKYNALHS